jgi:autotransporter-associated beta strand protein
LKQGAGTLILGNTSNNYTGSSNLTLNANGTQIQAGTLAIAADTSLGLAPAGAYHNVQFTGSGTLRSDSTISLNANRNLSIAGGATAGFDSNGNTFTINGAISGATGNVEKTGAGTVVLTGNNTYAATTITTGTLQIGNGSTTGNLGSGAVTNNAALSFNRTNTLTQGSDFGTISGTGTLTQAGSGTLVLGAANTYTGATTVAAGKFAVNGSTSASSAVGVSSGGTLGGSGSVGGNTTIAGGGTLAPGNSPGVLTIAGSTTLNSGSIFEWELDTAQSNPTTNRGTAYDGVNTTSLSGSGAIFKIMLTGTQDFADTFWNQTRTWEDIFKSADGSAALSGWAPVFSGGFQYSYNGQNVQPTTQGSFTMTGSSLTWSAVPEPSNAIIGLIAATALLRRRREN